MTTDERILRLKTPESCEQFAINVEKRGKPELALEARRRGVQLLASMHGAKTEAERDAWEVLYAYERVLSTKRGRATRASRTRPMIARYGIIETVERIVTRRTESTGYAALVEMGMEDMTAEAVVLRHPTAFSAKAIERSKERLAMNASPGSLREQT